MKRIMGTIVVVGMVASSAPAFAQGEDVPTQVVTMEELGIDGATLRPDGSLFKAPDKPKFKRLMELRRSMIPKILESAKSKVLE